MSLLHLEPQQAIWLLTESDSELYDQLSHPELFQAELEQFTTANRRREWLAVRLTLKALLGEETPVYYYPSGAPFLANGTQLSITHTQGYVAVRIGLQDPVGIDIEYRSDRIKRIASRFLHPTKEQIKEKDEDTHLLQLLIHWSAKETAFKVLSQLGHEGIEFAQQLIISPFTIEDPSGKLILTASIDETTTQFSIHYRITSDYVLTYI